jgi:hypothetical protein
VVYVVDDDHDDLFGENTNTINKNPKSLIGELEAPSSVTNK